MTRTDKNPMTTGIVKSEAAENNHDTSFALMARNLLLVDGLFQSIKDGDDSTPRLKAGLNIGGGTLEFTGPYILNAYDARLLTTLSAYSTTNGIRLTPEPKSEIGQITRALLDPKGQSKASTIYVMLSPAQLLKEMAIAKNGNTYKALTNSLRRLSEVTIWAKIGKADEALHMISYFRNENINRMCVAMNPIIAEAITGGQHSRLDMDEIRSIDDNRTFMLYFKLCALVDWPNGKKTKTSDGLEKSKTFTEDTLTGHLWTNKAKNGTSAQRMHRKRLRMALDKLASLPHWKIEEYVKGKFQITRLHNPKQ